MDEDEVYYEFNVGGPAPDPFGRAGAADDGAGPAGDAPGNVPDDAPGDVLDDAPDDAPDDVRDDEPDGDDAAAKGREMAEGLAEHLRAILQIGLPALVDVFGRRAEQRRLAGRLSAGAEKRLRRAAGALGCGERVGFELRRGGASRFLMAERVPRDYHVDAVYNEAAALAGGESRELTHAFAAVYGYVTAAFAHAMADAKFAAAAAPLFDGEPPPLLSADRASGVLYVAPGWDGIGCVLRDAPAPP